MAFRRHLQHRATHLPIDFVQCVVNHLSWTVETDSPVWTKYPRRPTKLPLINRSVVTTTRKSVCQFWFGQINRNAQNHPWAWNVKSINIVPQTDIDSLCSLVWIGDNVHRLHFDLFHLIFAEKKTERVTFSVPLRLLLLLLDRILFFFCSVLLPVAATDANFITIFCCCCLFCCSCSVVADKQQVVPLHIYTACILRAQFCYGFYVLYWRCAFKCIPPGHDHFSSPTPIRVISASNDLIYSSCSMVMFAVIGGRTGGQRTRALFCPVWFSVCVCAYYGCTAAITQLSLKQCWAD